MAESLNPQNQPHNPRMAMLAAAASVGTVFVLIIIKFIAYIDNGGVSVLASLIDSLVDAGASLVTMLAIHFSLKPADTHHRYGHGKAEGLAALFQSAFIAASGFFLTLQAIARFYSPAAPAGDAAMPIFIMLVCIGLSLLLVAIQKYSLRYAPSLAVEADKAHYGADIVINALVIAVLLAQKAGAPAWIDPLFALVVVAYLARTAKKVARGGVDMLLDRELPDDQREIITQKALSHPGVLGMHDLRTRKSGMAIFISFDIELDPSLLLYHAHEIVRQVELELLAAFPNAEILIHADPHGDTHDTRHGAAHS